MNIKQFFIVALVGILLGHNSHSMAQTNKVVVVPLGGDETANGVEYGGPSDIGLPINGDDIVVASIELDAPESGHVIVNFSTNLVQSNIGVAVTCDISKNAGPATRVINFQVVGLTFLNFNQNFTIGYPVDEGANEFVVSCAQQPNAQAVTTQNTFITAIFAPDRI